MAGNGGTSSIVYDNARTSGGGPAHGGALNLTNGPVTITNCTFTANKVHGGTGVKHPLAGHDGSGRR